MISVREIPDWELSAKISTLLENFHSRRVATLDSIELTTMLNRKNPFLYRAIGINNAQEIVTGIIRSFISSSDETNFGIDFFEPLAEYVATEAHKGQSGCSVVTAAGAGVDLQITTPDGIRLYAIKSGTNVFNSQSKKKQAEEFDAARKRMAKTGKAIVPIVGYGYGRKNGDSGRFIEMSGQALWADLSGDPHMYIRIIQAMNDLPIQLGSDIATAFDRATNRCTRELLDNFSGEDGELDWGDILEYGSSAKLITMTEAAKELGISIKQLRIEVELHDWRSFSHGSNLRFTQSQLAIMAEELSPN